MRYQAVIFDLDGTLLDTIEDITDAMNAALGRMGHPQHGVETCKHLVGDGMETFVRRSLPAEARDDPAAIRRLTQLMTEEYAKHGTDKTMPFNGIPELLDELTRRGAALAVLSNKPHPSTQIMVRRFLGRWNFRVVIGAQDNQPIKPNPSTALEITALLGLQPRDILFLGDSNTDMLTASAAGMYPVGALWGFRTAEELLSAGAKALVKNPADLLPLLD